MSLYTKYRPKDWDSVIGQDLISEILRNSLRQDRVGHAYILTGSRGTGKTTSARILAKGVNCTNLQDGNPCHNCINCIAFDNGSMLDVIEIDGASNNGVENVRDLIEKARFEPSQGKYKVYIIDEVHMLSTGAFNALLKTLEEPPKHVKFILATTEIDKVPETIRSRSLRFDFRKITEQDIVKRLEFVSQAEGIDAEREALEIIAKAARGGLRDALTLLEQNTINHSVSTEYVRSTLSLIEEALIDEITNILYEKKQDELLRILEIIRARHLQVRGFFDQMMYTLRDRLLENLAHDSAFFRYSEILACFEDAYTKIKALPDGMLLIELTLLRGVKGSEGVRNEAKSISPIKNLSQKTETIEKKTIPPIERKEETPQGAAQPILEEKKLTPPKEQEQVSSQNPPEKFSFLTLLHHMKTIRPALIVDLKTARYELPGDQILRLIFSKNWNFGRVNTGEVKMLIAESLEKCFSGTWTVECILDEGNKSMGNIDDVF